MFLTLLRDLERLQVAEWFLIGWLCVVASRIAMNVALNVLREALPIELPLYQGRGPLATKVATDVVHI